MGVFRKMQFRCVGCGAGKLAKLTVQPRQAADPIAPPPGWLRVDLTAQHPDIGAIGTLTLFACSQACADTVAAGAGVGKPYIDGFRAAFAPGGKHEIVQAPAMAPEEAAPDDGTVC